MKNTKELRAFILTRMENLANGSESIAQSHAVASLAKQVNATLSLELTAARLLGESQQVKELPIK